MIDDTTDICARKNGGNPESVAAFEKSRRTAQTDREACYALISQEPRTGKECARLLKRGFHTISPRITELKKAGRVTKTGLVRDGSAILRATGDWD